MRQYVVLGAGFDTFAYRNPHPESSLRVFEVDHPATQGWKRKMLAAAGIAVPGSLRFAPVDFERETLDEGLARAGFDPAVPSFFSWLGVAMYLTDDAFTATLGKLGAAAPGSGLVLDYAVPRAHLGWLQRLAHDRLSRRVAAAGEPFRTFFTPGELRARLQRAGFRDVEDLGPDELNARYFQGRRDGLRVRGALARLAAARC